MEPVTNHLNTSLVFRCSQNWNNRHENVRYLDESGILGVQYSDVHYNYVSGQGEDINLL